jgi:RND family efflux transporter MFP subunit
MMRSAVGAASLVIVVALMAASFAAGLVAGQRPTPAPPSPTATTTAPPSPSPSPTPVPGIVAEAVVVPQASVDVSAPITAQVESVFVDEDEQVRAGQLLLRLDTSTRRAALDVAEADLDRAVAAADRARTILEQLPDDAPLAQRDAAEADVRLAEAELEVARTALAAAQVALRQTELRAPFDGTVAEVSIGAGEQAVAGAPLVTIADLGAWHVVTTDISELDVVGIAVGDEAVITFPALPELELEGVVDQVRVRGTSDAGGVRFDVVIRPLTHRPELRWNMTAEVRILNDR